MEAKRAAGIKGNVDHFAALGFLQGLLVVLRDSGRPGLVVVLDEVETLQRMRGDVRDKALNALRQLIDEIDSRRFPGLYLIITGTPASSTVPRVSSGCRPCLKDCTWTSAVIPSSIILGPSNSDCAHLIWPRSWKWAATCGNFFYQTPPNDAFTNAALVAWSQSTYLNGSIYTAGISAQPNNGARPNPANRPPAGTARSGIGFPCRSRASSTINGQVKAYQGGSLSTLLLLGSGNNLTLPAQAGQDILLQVSPGASLLSVPINLSLTLTEYPQNDAFANAIQLGTTLLSRTTSTGPTCIFTTIRRRRGSGLTRATAICATGTGSTPTTCWMCGSTAGTPTSAGQPPRPTTPTRISPPRAPSPAIRATPTERDHLRPARSQPQCAQRSLSRQSPGPRLCPEPGHLSEGLGPGRLQHQRALDVDVCRHVQHLRAVYRLTRGAATPAYYSQDQGPLIMSPSRTRNIPAWSTSPNRSSRARASLISTGFRTTSPSRLPPETSACPTPSSRIRRPPSR